MASTFHVEHFGCRAARADGEALSDRLRAAGHCAQQSSEADVVIVNTCSVTAEADRAARAFIRRAHRLNPAARIVVTGCYAQRAPEELAGMAGVAAVVGNSHKGLAREIVLGLAGGRAYVGHEISARPTSGAKAPDTLVRIDVRAEALTYWSTIGSKGTASDGTASGGAAFGGSGSGRAPIWADDRFAHSFLEEAQVVPGAQTRPNLKIQEGCGNRCTFCVIPQTRGPSRSLSAASILRQVEGFVAAGGKELVFSGINLGRWGKDPSAIEETGSHGPKPRTLARLILRIFSQTELPRLRLSSIEPMDWDAELIGLMAEFGGSRLARHAHLPLQSGSDAVLRRMHRRYRPWHYAEKVEALLRAAGPDLTLGADVMVGFPGETDREFEETVATIRALPFGYLHLFPFSPRPGTPGWAMHDEHPVAAGAVEVRMAALRALAAEKSRAHRMRFVGRELEAITLHTPTEMEARGRTAALTENFLPLEMEGRLGANLLVRARVTGLNAEGLLEATLETAERDQYCATAMSV